uniref:Uncharacterized protein n=1 Tax=Panagrolaimus sp. JU765 TaxID=591449 RepID=A0AC34Q6X3_9BILA
MMATGLDDLTSALFARMRHGKNENGSVLLKCPRCPNRLKALLLEVYQENGETFQKVWWVCRGLKSKTCIFPLNMPPQVFWTRRTAEQMRQDVIPLPNFNLLPKEFWKLYPTIFTKAQEQRPAPYNSPHSQHEPFPRTSDVPEMITISEPEISPENGTIPAEPEATGTDEVVITTESSASEGNVVNTPESTRLLKPDTVKMLRLRPQEKKIITGGRNYDFKMMDEVLFNKDSGDKKIFSDIQSSLKATLAMRFAQREFSDRIADVIAENGINLQNDASCVDHSSPLVLKKSTSQNLVKQEKKSQCTTPDSMDVENDMTELKKMVESVKSIKKRKSLSSRLGIKTNIMDTTPKRTGLMFNQFNSSPMAENVIPEQSSLSAVSNPSTSTASLDSSKSVVPKTQDTPKMEFNSPELSSIVQRNRRLILSKIGKKRKRKANEV